MKALKLDRAEDKLYQETKQHGNKTVEDTMAVDNILSGSDSNRNRGVLCFSTDKKNIHRRRKSS